MRRLAAAVATAALASTAAFAQQKSSAPAAKSPPPPRVESGLVLKPSKLPVKETVDAIAKSAEDKGAKIVARVDHQAGAKAVGVEMKPSQVLLFGNPKVGTPLMQTNPRAGLDLPLKVLAYEDAQGRTWVVYTSPAALAKKYGLKSKAEAEAVKTAAGAFDAILAGSAIAP
jgi:uncharacterized protein (DUF302 family)